MEQDIAPLGAAAVAALATIIAQAAHARRPRRVRALVAGLAGAAAILLPFSVRLEPDDGERSITAGEVAAVCLALGVGGASGLDLLGAAASRGRRALPRWGHAAVVGAVLLGAGAYALSQVVEWHSVTMLASYRAPLAWLAISLAALAGLHASAARAEVSLAWTAIAAATAYRLLLDSGFGPWERPALACEGLVAPALAFGGALLVAPRTTPPRSLGLARQPRGSLAVVPAAASLALHVAVTVPGMLYVTRYFAANGTLGGYSFLQVATLPSPAARIAVSLGAVLVTVLALGICARRASTRGR